MHKPFKTQGAAYYAEGREPSGSGTTYGDRTDDIVPEVQEVPATWQRGSSPLPDIKKEASTAVMEVPATSRYPDGWAPEAGASMEPAKEARKQDGGRDENKGAKTALGMMETMAVGTVLAVLTLLG